MDYLIFSAMSMRKGHLFCTLAHKSDPRAEISGEIVWYDALASTSRGTVVLVFCLRMRRFPLTLVLTKFVGMK